MAEPTKQETEQVFKVLKLQKANKVCIITLEADTQFIWTTKVML